MTIFRESKLAHKYLDNLKGIEIGGAAHNPFGLNTINIDVNDDPFDTYRKLQKEYCGTYLKVDVIASGDKLPFEDESYDFVVNSHVLEHFWDPISALYEWFRVVKKGGFIFMIIPHKDRTFDKDRELTSLSELIYRHEHPENKINEDGHHSVWNTETFLELCKYLDFDVIDYQDVDDKVGNGFTIVLKKQ